MNTPTPFKPHARVLLLVILLLAAIALSLAISGGLTRQGGGRTPTAAETDAGVTLEIPAAVLTELSGSGAEATATPLPAP
jgi:hypothetical protein